MSTGLGALRPCMEGAIPAVMATCAADGTPNVAYLSQVFYVDEAQVALSFQFFNKTRQNILAQPQATVLVLHPQTAQFHRLHLRYVRTETSGPVFEGMKAQLAGIASHEGMAEVFRLRGADIYDVLAVETVDSQPLPAPPPRTGQLALLRRASERLARCAALDALLNEVIATLQGPLDMPHAMVLLCDESGRALYTVASCGYPRSGVGSEIALGDGVIGVAAQEQTPVRVNHLTSAYRYSQAVRGSLGALEAGLGQEIPYPGLAEPRSQMAVPIRSADRLLGVLFVESPLDMRFSYEDEDMLVALAGQIGATLAQLQTLQGAPPDPADDPAIGNERCPQTQTVLQVRWFAANHSVFVNGSYLIKGVAGAILCKLLRDHTQQGRTEFSNRELRLDPSLGLPEVADNLEARLLLLQRRLQEQDVGLRLEKTGRGRFRLCVAGPVVLAPG
jgi:adenylate cyclase